MALHALTTPMSMSDALRALHSQSQVALAQQRHAQQQLRSEYLRLHAMLCGGTAGRGLAHTVHWYTLHGHASAMLD
jgi:hypothetical protein